MKKTILFLVCLSVMLHQAYAYDFSAVAPSGQTLYYNIVNGNAEVTFQNGDDGVVFSPSYTSLFGNLTIPATVTYNGTTYSVTNISVAAFIGCIGLTSVTIPNSVTSIGNQAFGGVRHIQYYGTASGSPWGARHMNGFTEGDFIYSNSTKTTLWSYIGSGGAVTIPVTVTSIGQYAFYGCSGLTSVTIPNSVTSIGNYAFQSCSGLTSVTIPNSVTSIENRTFYGCSGLTSVTIGSSVTTIDYGAFADCSGLTEINSLNTVAPQLNLGQNQSDYPFSFSGVSTTIPVHIPCGSLLSYSSRWSYFSNFIEASGHSFDVVTADSTMGNVTILTQPTCQAPTAVFNAVPNSGYRFSNWSDGNTTNPRSLVVTQDTVIMAYFEASSDTIFIHDTIYIYDTIYIHDTIYVGGNAIDDVMTIDAKIYQRDGQIVVEGAEGMPVMLYDATGRLLATRKSEEMRGGTPVQFNVPASGTYLIKVGNYPARKVVVIR